MKTSYYRDNFPSLIFDNQRESMKARAVAFLGKSKNSNVLNSIAGLLGIAGGIAFLLGGF